LGKKYLSKTPKLDTPFIFTMIQKCNKYGIAYELMCRLNYYDLKALVVEYDIQYLKEYLKQLESSRNAKLNREVIDASNEDILKMHGR